MKHFGLAILALLIANHLLASKNSGSENTMDRCSYELWMPSVIATGSQISPIITFNGNEAQQVVNFTTTIKSLKSDEIVYQHTDHLTADELSDAMPLGFPLWDATEGNYSAILNVEYPDISETQSIVTHFEVVNNRLIKKPLYEVFSSSTCGPCAYANPVLNAVLEANPGTHSLIKYQMNWPGNGDPYYTPEGGVRRTYYSINSVPALRINSSTASPSQMTQAVYDSYIGLPTDMEINIINAHLDEDLNITIDLGINVLTNYNAGLKAHIVVVEKVTTGNVANNGERYFKNVMLKMLPNASGTTLPALTPGNTHTISQSFNMGSTFMEIPNRLAVIVFVQNDGDKSVIQSEMVNVTHNFEDYNVTFNITDNSGNAVEGANIFLSQYGEKITGTSGQVMYEDVVPGTYTYEIFSAGFISQEGTILVNDQNLVLNIQMLAPEAWFFEDFTNGIPSNWTTHSTSPDFLYSTGGKVIFFRQNANVANPIILVAPPLDLSNADMIYFDAGEVQGSPQLLFGTMSDPNDPATWTELELYNPPAQWNTFSYNLSQLDGQKDNVYLAWRHSGSMFTYFSFDNVTITASQTQTYSLSLFADPPDAGIVTGAGDYPAGTQITLLATVNQGFNFLNWSDASGNIISTEPEFEFTMPAENTILVAYFGVDFLLGDANCDGTVNIVDVVIIANKILGLEPEPFCFENADINGDGVINLNDLIATVNLILN